MKKNKNKIRKKLRLLKNMRYIRENTSQLENLRSCFILADRRAHKSDATEPNNRGKLKTEEEP